MKRSPWKTVALVAFLLLVPGAIPVTLISIGAAKYSIFKKKKNKENSI